MQSQTIKNSFQNLFTAQYEVILAAILGWFQCPEPQLVELLQEPPWQLVDMPKSTIYNKCSEVHMKYSVMLRTQLGQQNPLKNELELRDCVRPRASNFPYYKTLQEARVARLLHLADEAQHQSWQHLQPNALFLQGIPFGLNGQWGG